MGLVNEFVSFCIAFTCVCNVIFLIWRQIFYWRHSWIENATVRTIWLYWLRGTFPLLFCLSVSIPSSIFLCVLCVKFSSLLIILDSSQSISCWHIVTCFANPPSRSFILFVALSTFPFLRYRSSLVSPCLYALFSLRVGKGSKLTKIQHKKLVVIPCMYVCMYILF